MMRIVAVFVGWIMGLWSPIATLGVTRWILGPELHCDVIGEEVPTNVPAVRQWFVSVRMSNLKPRIARECRGYITKIEELTGGLPTKMICDKTLQCIWEFDDQRDCFDIPQGARPAFNVVMIEDGKAEFSLRIRTSGGKVLNLGPFQHLLARHGALRFSGICTADELAPLPFCFDLKWDGQWPPTLTAI
jgi:hypothetical protein